MNWARQKVGRSAEDIVRVDGRPLPPVLVGGEAIDRKVQMGRLFRGVARSADVSQRLPAVHAIPFLDAVRVALQVSVIVRGLLAGIELVDGDTPSLAFEHLADGPLL